MMKIRSRRLTQASRSQAISFRSAYILRRDDDWGQAGTLSLQVLDDAARDRLVSNVVAIYPTASVVRCWRGHSRIGRTWMPPWASESKNLFAAGKPERIRVSSAWHSVIGH